MEGGRLRPFDVRLLLYLSYAEDGFALTRECL